MFQPRNIYPTGNSELECDAFRAGLQRAYGLCRDAPKQCPHILAGKHLLAVSRATYETVDPNIPSHALASFPKHDLSDHEERIRLDAGLKEVAIAQKRWARVPLKDRVKLVRTIGQLVSDQAWFMIALMSLEGGKRPFPNGVGEFMEVVDFCNSAAALAEEMYSKTSPVAPEFMCDFNGRVFEPKGVIVDIEPFNFAQAIPMDKIAMALVTGNAIIMKASGHTPLQGYMLYEIIQSAFDACGLENNGVANFLSGHGAELASYLLKNQNVTGLTFTGSYDAYWSIQRNMLIEPRDHGGKLQEIAAETSGCNALIVADDADIDAAVVAARDSLINNCGQTCSHLGHLIIDNKIKDEFCSKFIAALKDIRFGDVKDTNNHCGALISRDAVDRCEASVRRLVGDGFVSVYFTKEIKGRNAFDFAPRVLLALPNAIKDDSLLRKVRSTEIFGMAVILWFADTRDQARKIFETCKFALTGGIFTRDVDYALDFSLNYRGAAQKYINMRITGATVGMAFGGSALSGSSGDGVGASTRQALGKYVSEVNVAVRLPSGLSHDGRNMWHAKFAESMPTVPET